MMDIEEAIYIGVAYTQIFAYSFVLNFLLCLRLVDLLQKILRPKNDLSSKNKMLHMGTAPQTPKINSTATMSLRSFTSYDELRNLTKRYCEDPENYSTSEYG